MSYGWGFYLSKNMESRYCLKWTLFFICCSSLMMLCGLNNISSFECIILCDLFLTLSFSSIIICCVLSKIILRRFSFSLCASSILDSGTLIFWGDFRFISWDFISTIRLAVVSISVYIANLVSLYGLYIFIFIRR